MARRPVEPGGGLRLTLVNSVDLSVGHRANVRLQPQESRGAFFVVMQFEGIYRLEQFEEIIKEGRKFGVFITVASQRPADISPTIVSQIHNFFIHRLVNERDLFLIDNTITTLDSLSRNLIPGLSQGCCVVTGTAFDLPMLLQVERLEKAKQPDSEDVDLDKLWG